MTSRRAFMGLAAGAVAAGCAAPARQIVDLTPALASRVAGRGFPPYLEVGTSSFPDHVRRQELSLGGIDYGPIAAGHDTLVAPAAAGAVIASLDAATYAGMSLTVAHGLGWKTIYAHLKARYAGFRDTVERREVIAVMGASGLGASRGGLGVARHLHLSLFGPAWSALFSGASLQIVGSERLMYRFGLDPEEFSLAGRNEFLPFSREEDRAPDAAFLALHDEAVRVADGLLDRIGDREAAEAKQRASFEQATKFDVNVDQRLWFVWNRLERGGHPFDQAEVPEIRATLRRFMSAAPRLTAPIVEPDRRTEYRMRRPSPVKIYDGRTL